MSEKEILEISEEKVLEFLPIDKDNEGIIGQSIKEFENTVNPLISSYIRLGFLMGYKSCLVDKNNKLVP